MVDENAIEAALDAFDNTYEAEYLSTGATDNKAAAIRAAILAYEQYRGKQEPVAWPEPAPPTEGVSYYDHIKAHGYSIEWKSWKDVPGYVVMRDAVSEEYVGTFNSLEDAKEAVEARLASPQPADVGAGYAYTRSEEYERKHGDHKQ